MKLCLAASILASASAALSPARLSFDELDGAAVRKALTDIGILSVTNVPGLVSGAPAPDCDAAPAVEHVFEDGTVRSTVATHPRDARCAPEFRRAMGAVASRFAAALSGDLAKVADEGETLEHFHSYEKKSAGDDIEANFNANADANADTVEWHTDQGLFIVFTPGRLQDGSLSEGFFVRLSDGSEHEVQFDSQVDQAIVLPGDMITEFVEGVKPTAHRLALPAGTRRRTWYGRMVLPAPTATFRDGVTFGELRERMIDGDAEALALGCPSSKGAVARQLEEESCAEGTLLCWHRCMDLTAELPDISEEFCAEQGLDLRCINPRGQLWTDRHGDYYPACIDASAAENFTEFPPLPTTCDENGQSIAVSTSDANIGELSLILSKFKYSFKLNDNMTFAWNVEGDSIHASIAIQDEFGWLAWGFPSVDGKRRGMHGASIVLATPGGDYSAVTGLDTSLDPTIAEYVIDPVASTFRKWMEPVGAAPAGSSIVRTTDCASVLETTSSSINGMPFNVTGTDAVIWGGNSVDTFVGYHGRANRGVFNVTWAKGIVNIDGEYQEVMGGETPPKDEDSQGHDHGDHDDHDHGDDKEEPSSSAARMGAIAAFVAAGLMALL